MTQLKLLVDPIDHGEGRFPTTLGSELSSAKNAAQIGSFASLCCALLADVRVSTVK